MAREADDKLVIDIEDLALMLRGDVIRYESKKGKHYDLILEPMDQELTLEYQLKTIKETVENPEL